MKSLFLFWGKVKKGKERGKSLGFPTANIALYKNIPEGVRLE
jgi:FAD synthase